MKNGSNLALSEVRTNYKVAYQLAKSSKDRNGIYEILDLIEDDMPVNPALSPEEFKCLVDNGFCALLAMKFPELLENEAFQFMSKGLLAIEMLEEQCEGKDYNDFTNYIDAIIEKSEPNDKELYQSIKKYYTESERKEYLGCKELYKKQSQAQQTEKQSKSDLDPDF